MSTAAGRSAFCSTTVLASLRYIVQSRATPLVTRVSVARTGTGIVRSFSATRFVFATKTSRPTGKPKRATPAEKAKTVKAKAKKAAAAKSQAAKKKAASAKKPKKTSAVKKLTDEQKAKRKEILKKKEIIARKKELKEQSLISEEPKQGLSTAYIVFSQEKGAPLRAKGLSVPDVSKQLSDAFNKLSSSELDKYKLVADQNRAVYVQTHAEWLKSKTPSEILAANQARIRLKRMGFPSRSLLKDDRLPTRPRLPFNFFFMDFMKANTDDKPVTEIMKDASAKWQSMGASQKKASYVSL